MVTPSTASKAPHANCSECPLKDRGFAASSGPSTAKAFVLSRSPGKHDVAAGRPFAGPSGKILDYLLESNDVSRSDVFCTNVVLCETDSLEGTEGERAIKACLPRLRYELGTIKTDTYIAAGAEALRVLSDGKRTLRSSRGKRLPAKDGSSKFLVATYNPAAALRDDVVFPDLVQDFRRAFTPRRCILRPTVTVLQLPKDALEWLTNIQRNGVLDGTVIAVDIESTGLSATDSILSIGFSFSDTESVVIGREALADPEVQARLNEFLARDYAWLYHNGKFDVKLLRANGYPNARVVEDTMLLSYICDERPGVHSLDYLIQNELDWEIYEPIEVSQGKKYGFSEQPITRTRQLKSSVKTEVVYEGFSAWDKLYKYNGFDTAGSRQIFSILSDRAKSEGTRSVYERLLIPASNCLADVEAHGVCFDVDEARRISRDEVLPELGRLRVVCGGLVGQVDFNPNSHQQVAAFLYDECGVTNPLYRRGKDRSVDSAVRQELLRLGGQSTRVTEFLESVERFKKLDKLRGTYLDSLADRVGSDGRIRCDFLLHGTESGRLSSRNPNLQNVPRSGKDGLPNIRSLFVAPEGRCIVQADYSQAELRTIAVVSGDEALLEIYRSGKDLHTEVASELYGSHFTKEQRVIAKNYNFGIAYGQQAFSFSQMYHISRAQAERDIQKWWTRFPGVKRWTKEVHQQTKQNGQLSSAFGRKRRFPLITDENLDHVMKEAGNFVIQSTASDFTLGALVTLMNDGELDLQRAYPIILVHDSIVLEANKDYAVECGNIVAAAMKDAPIHYLGWEQIPFEVDVQVGTTWGDLE